MSSFKWGMIACPTPTNSQVTVWKLRQPLFSLHIRIVLLSALHSDALLGSAGMPLHFGLFFCNALEQINPPYPIWKGTSIALIWGIVACPVPRICRDMALVKDPVNRPSYCYNVVSLGFTPFALNAATLYLVRASSTWQQVALIFGSCHFQIVSNCSTMIWQNLWKWWLK